MSTYILFDNNTRTEFLPFTHTRPVADIRCGILTMRERWERYLNRRTGTLTASYLQTLFPHTTDNDCVYINGCSFANASLVAAIQKLKSDEALVSQDVLLACRTTTPVQDFQELAHLFSKLTIQHYTDGVRMLEKLTDIFALNDAAIRDDYQLLTAGRTSAPLPSYVQKVGEDIFLEPGAKVQPGTVLNASSGPIYLAADAEIMEGCLVRGPVALGEHATLKMGAKVYGASTIGEGCKVGGEINNVVFFSNSNKGHDGFLGNAVVGSWCNLGADTNCSNLKNNYDEVKIWHEASQQLVPTGLQFCGLLMGDHSKCGINTMFNTGTVVGVSANIFGGGFPDKFIPSFSWGGSEKMTTYQFEKAMETAERMMARRNKQLSEAERSVYQYIFEQTKTQRNFS